MACSPVGLVNSMDRVLQSCTSGHRKVQGLILGQARILSASLSTT